MAEAPLDEAALLRALEAVEWTPVTRPTPVQGLDGGEVYATHEGVLALPGLGTVPCYRLNTGEPVFDIEALTRLLGLEES